jgi:hypothetical protein
MNDMTPEPELLVQRFLDQELSPEERIRFIAQLGRNEGLRQRAIEMEQLLLDVSRLPRPRVPDGFAERVLERTAPATSVRARVTKMFFAPHELRWNLAGAVATAGLLLLVIAGTVARNARVPTSARLPVDPPSAGAPNGHSTARSPRGGGPGAAAALGWPAAVPMPSTVLVRLVIVQPGARSVQVAGDFNGWNPARTPLDEMSAGAWTVTIPLEPGRYEYMYVVDGQQWIADPFAVEHNDDGFGSRNAVLDVRPVPSAVEGPAVEASGAL